MESKKEKWLRVGIMFGSVMLSVIVTIVSAIKLGSASTSGTSGTISLDSIITLGSFDLYCHRTDFFGVFIYIVYKAEIGR